VGEDKKQSTTKVYVARRWFERMGYDNDSTGDRSWKDGIPAMTMLVMEVVQGRNQSMVESRTDAVSFRRELTTRAYDESLRRELTTRAYDESLRRELTTRAF